MNQYPFEAFTRVVVLPEVDDLAVPTIGEALAGDDITCELTKDGLRLERSTSGTDRTPWRGPLEVTEPTRYSYDGAGLTAYHSTGTEVLWDLCEEFRGIAVLLVRRGVPYETTIAEGDVVSLYRIVWGARSEASSAQNAMQTFSVPLFVIEDQVDVVLLAGS